jgi:anti-sigma regulatory factor (Ser/Thr protein kinase)
MSEAAALRVGVAARAENIAIVRQALAGLVEAIGLDQTAVFDLKTIVTEACMNAVVHAYEEESGPLDVSAWLDDEGLQVAVRDHGGGFKPRPASSAGGPLRLGLPLIAALSDEFEIRAGAGRGTEVRIRKRTAVTSEVAEGGIPQPGDATTLEFSPEAPVQPVLARVLGAVAARADLSIDRLSDMQMLGDAVSAEAPASAPEGRLTVTVSNAPRRLELRVGPLAPGGADRLLEAMEQPGPPIGALRALATEVRREQPDGGEVLMIALEEGPGDREQA